MAYYRLYQLEGAHFRGVAELDAKDDAQAIRQAAELAGTGGAELWCGPRRVERFQLSFG